MCELWTNCQDEFQREINSFSRDYDILMEVILSMR